MHMSINDLSEVLQHAGFLSAVLGGFAVTLFVTLLTMSRDNKVVPYAAGASLLAAVFLGLASITGVAGMVGAILDQEAALGPENESTIYGAFRWTSVSFFLGMIAFLTSLGICGWIRSRRFGLFSTTSSLITFAALVYFLVVVVRAF